MLLALSRRGYAPEALVRTNRRGVPVKAIALTVTIGFLSVIMAAIWPETVFPWLVNSSGAVALFCYLLIAVSQLIMRRRLEREDPEALTLKMWLFPWLTLASIGAIVAVIFAMALVDDVRDQLWWSLASLAVVVGLAVRRTRRMRARTGTVRRSGRGPPTLDAAPSGRSGWAG